MGERSYLSIGDVLALLREEFPDITISKIRFLESRGLLVPERTPSGYRKFYDHDVDRLRWILRQQREHFLPLKVIKGRLEGQVPPSEPEALFEVERVEPRHAGASAGDEVEAGSEGVLEPALAGNGSHGMLEGAAQVAAQAAAGPGRAQALSTPAAAPGLIAPRPQPVATRDVPSGRTEAQTRPAAASPVPAGLEVAETAAQHERSRHVATGEMSRPQGPRSGHAASHAGGAGAGEGRPSSGSAGSAAAARQAAPHAVPSAAGAVVGTRAPAATDRGGVIRASSGSTEIDPASAPGQALGADAADSPDVSAGAGLIGGGGDGGGEAVSSGRPVPDGTSLSGASLTVAELAQASGLDERQVAELESYGLIDSRMVAGVHCYDEEALVIAGLAASFARFGVEARHLKLFKHAAERQASLYSQVVMPLLRQRNPDARRRAHDDLTRLSDLGAAMQACFAKAVLRDLTRG